MTKNNHFSPEVRQRATRLYSELELVSADPVLL